MEATIYKNNTVLIPIEIINPSSQTLFGIRLSAEVNKTLKNKITIKFTKSYFDKLEPDKKKRTTLIIESYKTMPKYEVLVKAKVNTPDIEDSAKVLINSIELGEESEKEFNTKIAFTRDLLRENPECLELNEFLDKAKEYVDNGEYDKANALIESIVRTCKYLVTKKEPTMQVPKKRTFISSVKTTMTDPLFIILFSVIITSIIFVVSYLKKKF